MFRKLIIIMNREKFIKWFKSSIPWMLLIVGLLLFTFTEFYTFFSKKETMSITFNKNWLTWLSGISKAILISGISSVLLNSFEYMGIFRGVMVDIVMGEAYLDNRKDLDKHWEKITLLLFKNRFPAINNQITKDVKETYLPIDVPKYYDGATEDISISIVNKALQIVEVVNTTTFTINTWDAKQMLGYSLINDIACEGQNSSHESFEIVNFTIDGEDIIPTGDRNVRRMIDGKWCLLNSLKVKNITGKLLYKVNFTIKKTYSLKYDNILYNLLQHIHHGIDIYFHLDGVSLDIIKIGTLQKFETIKRNNKYIHLKYNGLIYPQQGYIAIIKKI